AGTERTLLLLAAIRPSWNAEEAAENRIVEQRIADRYGLGGIDVDDGRRDALHHRSIGQAHFVGGGRQPALLRLDAAGCKRRRDRGPHQKNADGNQMTALKHGQSRARFRTRAYKREHTSI